MAKQIKVSDEVYDRLKADADANYRSMSGQVEYLMDRNMGVSNILGEKVAFTTTQPTERFNEARSSGDVLADIREIESQRDEELRYCQDNETIKAVSEQYQDKLDVLWEEYNGLRGV